MLHVQLSIQLRTWFLYNHVHQQFWEPLANFSHSWVGVMEWKKNKLKDSCIMKSIMKIVGWEQMKDWAKSGFRVTHLKEGNRKKCAYILLRFNSSLKFKKYLCLCLGQSHPYSTFSSLFFCVFCVYLFSKLTLAIGFLYELSSSSRMKAGGTVHSRFCLTRLLGWDNMPLQPLRS